MVVFYKAFRRFSNHPTIFKDEVFTQAFEKAELAKFNPTELEKYENSLKMYRDLKGVIDTAFDEGKIEVAKNLKTLGVDFEIISKSTGLTREQINRL